MHPGELYPGGGGDDYVVELTPSKNLCCGCSLESPGRGDSNEHPQHRFLAHLSRRLKGELIVYRSIRASVS